jgi:hypothetical protein
MSNTSHPPWLYHPNNIWRRVQMMELLIMQFSAASRHFIPFRSKYSPKHPVLKQPQSVFFPDLYAMHKTHWYRTSLW